MIGKEVKPATQEQLTTIWNSVRYASNDTFPTPDMDRDGCFYRMYCGEMWGWKMWTITVTKGGIPKFYVLIGKIKQ